MEVFIYIIDVFMLMITTYFFNQILLLFLSLIRTNKARRLWSGILLTVLDFSLLWVYAISAFVAAAKTPGPQLSAMDVFIGVIRIIAIGFVYFFFMTMLFGKLKFKSRRQKEFERAMGNREKNYAVPILICSIALVAGIIGWVIYQINYTSDFKNDLIISIVITAIGAIGLAYFVTKAILVKKKGPSTMQFTNEFNGTSNFYQNQAKENASTFTVPKVEKDRTCIFIIQDANSHYFFKGTYCGKVALNDLVGTIGDYYYVSSYGTLKAKGNEYDLFGVKTSYFDDSLLSQIKLEPYDSEEIEAILPYLEKNRAKVFELDQNNNPINSFDA